MRTLTKQQVEAFKNSLALDEKSKATIQKYMRDVHAFYAFILGKEIEKEQMIAYKKHLLEQHYAVRTVNSMLCSINRLMHFLGWEDCIVKGLRLQRQIYQSEQKELTKAEYHRLLRAAEHKPRLQMILKTIGCTGIRVSELQYFTVESVKKRKILISCKGKIRTILLPSMLQKRLLNYCRQYNIHNGLAFCTRSGKPLDRSNIWTAMKKLCAAKVYTYQIDIDKYTGEYGTDGKTATHLAGATFQLKNSNATGATPIDLVAEANAEDGSLVYHIKGTDETTATAVTDVTTPENGKITIKGLKAGPYYLFIRDSCTVRLQQADQAGYCGYYSR